MDGMDSSIVHVLHTKFNADDGDIIIQSSDKIQFSLHRKNLEYSAGAFPLEGLSLKSGLTTIDLPEPASVLEVVFEYIYPKRYRDLGDKDFDILIAIAGAVEKYKVFAAMHLCVISLGRFVAEYPLEILMHAHKYDYPDLILQATRHLPFCPLLETADKLPASNVLPWLRYHKAARTVVFDRAKALMEHEVSFDCSVLAEWGIPPAKLGVDCRNALVAWITYLEGLSSRESFEKELEAKTKFSMGGSCQDDPGTLCLWSGEVTMECKNGLESADSILFTSYLEGSK